MEERFNNKQLEVDRLEGAFPARRRPRPRCPVGLHSVSPGRLLTFTEETQTLLKKVGTLTSELVRGSVLPAQFFCPPVSCLLTMTDDRTTPHTEPVAR